MGKKYYNHSREKESEQYFVRKAALGNRFNFFDDKKSETVFTPKSYETFLELMKKKRGYTKGDLVIAGEVLKWPGGESPSLAQLT